MSEIDPDSVGVNPAWRKAVAHAAFGVSWPEGTSSRKIPEMAADVKQVESQLRELTPSSGAYFNEVHHHFFWHHDSRPDHSLMCRHRYGRRTRSIYIFGDHYPTLKLIKDKYDPNRLFVVAEGVGSEDWDADLRCRLSSHM